MYTFKQQKMIELDSKEVHKYLMIKQKLNKKENEMDNESYAKWV